MGKNHARVYSELPDVELIGIADINKNDALLIGKKYGSEAFYDYKDLLKKDLDLVSIAVPTSLHKKIALDVINSEVNVLIEKPISATVEDGEKIIAAAKQNKYQTGRDPEINA